MTHTHTHTHTPSSSSSSCVADETLCAHLYLNTEDLPAARAHGYRPSLDRSAAASESGLRSPPGQPARHYARATVASARSAGSPHSSRPHVPLQPWSANRPAAFLRNNPAPSSVSPLASFPNKPPLLSGAKKAAVGDLIRMFDGPK
jgi:hypothetical protein